MTVTRVRPERPQIVAASDKETLARLDTLVERGPRGLNRSDYIRQAVEDMLNRELAEEATG